MSLEPTIETREKPEKKKNVHYWLRKVFLFVDSAPEETSYPIEDSGEKGQPEKELRKELCLDPDNISRKEALEACKELFKMFMEPFEPDVQEFIADPHCPGGRPRAAYRR